MSNDVEHRTKRIEEVTGFAPRSIIEDIEEMLEGGLLISISVHGVSIISRSLKWEELGFRTGDEKNKRLRAGAKLLVSPEYAKRLKSIEVRFRQCADKFTRSLEAFRPWQWLPLDAYDAFLERWNELQGELASLKAEGVARHAEFVDENATYYGNLARRSWRTFQASYESGAALVLPDGHTFGPSDENAYVDWVISNVVSQMPTAEDFAQRIRAEYRTAVLFTQADLADQAARRAEAQAREAEALTRESEAYEQRRLMRIAADEEAETVRTRNEAIRRAEVERAREQLEQTISPLDQMLEQLMGEIQEGAQAVLESIERNGHVRGKVAERARGLRDVFQMMGGRHLRDHGDLENLLEELSSRLDRPARDSHSQPYNVEHVVETLGNVINATRENVGEIMARTEVQTRASALEFES